MVYVWMHVLTTMLSKYCMGNKTGLGSMSTLITLAVNSTTLGCKTPKTILKLKLFLLAIGQEFPKIRLFTSKLRFLIRKVLLGSYGGNRLSLK